MEKQTTIRLELGIEGQRFIQQLHLHNELIEKQVSEGIELALKDLSDNNNFVEYTRNATKIELQNIVHQKIFSYEIKMAIAKKIEEKIGIKLEEFANKMANKLFEQFEK